MMRADFKIPELIVEGFAAIEPGDLEKRVQANLNHGAEILRKAYDLPKVYTVLDVHYFAEHGLDSKFREMAWLKVAVLKEHSTSFAVECTVNGINHLHLFDKDTYAVFRLLFAAER